MGDGGCPQFGGNGSCKRVYLHRDTNDIRKLDNDTLNLYTPCVTELMSLGVNSSLFPGRTPFGLGTRRNLIYEQDYWN